jgi:GNAT superfamily N-acetyltransferase
MPEIEVRAVQNEREKRTFLTFPWLIYKGDPLWVPPVLSERARTIDPHRGQFFQRGEADFFIAWRNGKPVGTICAAQDPPTNRNRGTRECVFGFFEYIQDFAVFKALVDRAVQWAVDKDLNALYGPFNLDYEDSYGVLIEGRDRPPVIMCGHSPPYYAGFMERYGFQPARDQNIALAIDFDSPALDRLVRVSERVRKRGRITVRTANFEDWDAEIDRVHHLLNTATAHLKDHIGWHRNALEAMLLPFKKLADRDLILFADVAGETVGFLPGLPNYNEALIHANGLRYPWDYVRLWWHMRSPPECMAVKSILVLPEYWNTGVAVLLGAELLKRGREKGYRWADLSITGAENPNTVILAEHLSARIYKRWQVYRKRVH